MMRMRMNRLLRSAKECAIAARTWGGSLALVALRTTTPPSGSTMA